MDLPTPEPAELKLVSAGYPRPTWTVHRHVETLPCVVPGVGPQFEFIFQCSETGARRRYGLADRPLLGDRELERVIAEEGN